MTMNEIGRSKERWIKQYSSEHNILLVGEGDLSFSLSLGMAFGSATNIVATTLDSYDKLVKKYKNARSNVKILKSLGATLSFGVDATNMADLPDLRWKKFDRIIYNFPHAGFHGSEHNPNLIMMHRDLVRGFLRNASSLLWVDGEVHINHKITEPFNSWRIDEIASDCSLLYVGRDRFKVKDYPWYRNKRGSGWRSDEAFPLGACRTFKFKARPRAHQYQEKRRKRDPSPSTFNDVNSSLNGYTGEPSRYDGHHHCGDGSLEVRRSVLHRLSRRKRRGGGRGNLLITRAF
ncbi:hypothetical protein ACS0TY_032458 [Phlomoides rotata]